MTSANPFQEYLDARIAEASLEPRACAACGAPLDGNWCRACARREERAAALRRLRELTLPLVRAMPTWRRSTHINSPQFTQRCSISALREFAAAYEPSDGSAVLSGPSGCGKTTALVAFLNRALETAWESADPTHWVTRAFWTNGHALVRARRETKLGTGEAPVIAAAIRASVLFVDELGFEPLCEVPFEIVDARYCSGLPTIITTGLRIDPEPGGQSLRQRYGDACVRRLLERGSRIEGWKRAP